jgi:hypothetical protein
MSLGVSSLLDQFPASQEYSAIADSEIAEPPPFQDRSSQQHRGGMACISQLVCNSGQ